MKKFITILAAALVSCGAFAANAAEGNVNVEKKELAPGKKSHDNVRDFKANATSGGEVILDDFAVVGGGSLVHQFCHIGAHVMLQGGSLVNKDVPPYVKAGRDPLAYAGINSIGLRRRGFTSETIREIQETYRYIFQSNLNVSSAIERIEAELPATKERDEILLFVRNSRRGIIKGYC